MEAAAAGVRTFARPPRPRVDAGDAEGRKVTGRIGACTLMALSGNSERQIIIPEGEGTVGVSTRTRRDIPFENVFVNLS